jgi:hypothetical protein
MMMRLTGPMQCGYCVGEKRVDDNECPRCQGDGFVFVDQDGDAVRMALTYTTLQSDLATQELRDAVKSLMLTIDLWDGVPLGVHAANERLRKALAKHATPSP